MKPRIVWFRNDLRIRDNAALFNAQKGSGNVIPVFILSPKTFQIDVRASAKARFIYRTFQNLIKNLEMRNSRLIIRVGNELEELLKLSRETGAEEIYFNLRYAPDLFKLDEKIKKGLESAGLKVLSFHSETIFSPTTIMNKKKPITSFSDYRQRWLELDQPEIQPNISKFKAYGPAGKGLKSLNELHSDALPDLSTMGYKISGKIPSAGEDEGLDNLSWFFDRRVMYYRSQRAYPQVEGTSKLSYFISVGALSPLMVLSQLKFARIRATENQNLSIDNWAVSYIWRDFYHQLLFHFPKLVNEPFLKRFADFPYENNEAWIEAFKNGLTGYPLIDAGIKQMSSEFWMHGRLRVIVASFLVKNLLIDWRIGVEIFLSNMLDGDIATCTGSFQWTACLGAERELPDEVIDPVQQSKMMDPDGNFIRKHLPKLAKVPDAYIHTPWLMPTELQEKIGITIGKDYPSPIVDLKESSAKFLKIFRSLEGS